LTEQLKKAQREKADLQRKAAILEEQVNGEAMEFGRRFQERERVQQELLADNTRLYQMLEIKLVDSSQRNFAITKSERTSWNYNAAS
jgi:hypothetical protein